MLNHQQKGGCKAQADTSLIHSHNNAGTRSKHHMIHNMVGHVAIGLALWIHFVLRVQKRCLLPIVGETNIQKE